MPLVVGRTQHIPIHESLQDKFLEMYVSMRITAILGLEIDDADQLIDGSGTVENRLKMPGRFSQSRSDFDAVGPNRELLCESLVE